jgi:hypothetical protein
VRWLLLLVVIAAIAASAFLLKPEESAPAEPAPSVPEWAGSDSCAECHPDIFGSWKGTAHALTLQDFSSEVVAKQFVGEYFVARDVEQRIGPGPVMECEGPGGDLRRFEVGMVIGLRRVQMFTTTMEDGRIQVLPVFLEVPRKKWFDYADFIFGGPSGFEIPPDSANSWYTYARNFNSRCGRCHITNYEIGYDADRGIYETRWSERTIGCETCHGPSGAHIERWQGKRTGEDPIVNPSKLSVERANQVCGQCHAEGEMIVPGYRPGDDLFEYVDVHGLEDDRHLLPDGRANTHHGEPLRTPRVLEMSRPPWSRHPGPAHPAARRQLDVPAVPRGDRGAQPPSGGERGKPLHRLPHAADGHRGRPRPGLRPHRLDSLHAQYE